MRVLITGAAGFIGSNLCRHLIHEHEIVALDDFSTGSATNLQGLDVEVFQGSILDPVLIGEAVKGCDAIVHLAARGSVPKSLRDPQATNAVNVTGTLNVLDAARSANRDRGRPPQVLFASSSSVYGANPQMPKTEDLRPMPMSPYAVSKLAGEQYALAWQKSFDATTAVFRFFNVYGPNQQPGHAYAAAIPAFIYSAITGQPAKVFGDGLQTRDFTFVADVCEVLARALAWGVNLEEPQNLAFGSSISLLDLIAEIEHLSGRNVPRRFDAPRQGDVRASEADPRRLLQNFPGINPTPLTEGLSETIAWMEHAIANGHLETHPEFESRL